MATEEKAPVEWAAERILGVRQSRAYAILGEIGARADLEACLRQKMLVGMGSGRVAGELAGLTPSSEASQRTESASDSGSSSS
jgi:hypothetical protein